MMRKPGPRYGIVSMFVVLGCILLYFIVKNNPYEDIISTIRAQSAYTLAIFVAISVGLMLLQTWRWHLIIQSTGRKVPFSRAFQYKIVGYGISFLTPTPKIGGEPVRAALLEKEGFTYRKSLATITVDKVIELSTMGVLFVFGALVSILFFALPKNTVYLLVGISVIILGVITIFYYKMLENDMFLVKLFRQLGLNKIKLIKGMEQNIITFDRMLIKFYDQHRKVFYKALTISVLSWCAMFFEYYVILVFFGYYLNVAQLFLIITVMGVAYMLPIPLALGVLEAGQVYVFRLLRLNGAAGVGLAMIIRVRDLIWTIVAVILLTYHGFNFRGTYNKALRKDNYKTVEEDLDS